jgi:hypothetical protein
MRRVLFAICLLACSIPTARSARADPKKDKLDLVALPSSPSGITPLNISKRSWAYPSFCAAGGALTQTFPVNLTLTNGDGHPGDSRKVHFSASGTLAPYTTLPPDPTITDDGSVNGPYNIDVNASGLAPGTYTLSVGVKAPGAFAVRKSVSVTVVVSASCVGTFVSFYSDEMLVELLDCNGFDIGTGTGGTFQIVPAPGGATVAFTVPDSLYDNFIWTNTTASSIGVELDLASSGFVPTGADAVHVKTFSTATFTADLPTFQAVNSTGTSCGTSGPCTVTVNAGETLWATWAGTWDGIGGSTASLSNVCPGTNATVTNTNTLLQSSVTISGSANSATGYLAPCPSGDVNGDGFTNVSDVFYLINFLFAGGPAPTCGSGNVDGVGGVDVADVFYLINFLFAGGPPPL